MYAMFQKALVFNNNISSWDVSSVLSMESMFDGAEQFEQKICDWNIDEFTTVRGMFLNSKCTVAECVECATSSPTTFATTSSLTFTISIIIIIINGW